VERAEIDAAYAERLGELEVAPDCITHRSGSTTDEPPLHDIDAKGRSAILSGFDALMPKRLS
jgi:hypothetical protein